jgi:hypothetical protein
VSKPSASLSAASRSSRPATTRVSQSPEVSR